MAEYRTDKPTEEKKYPPTIDMKDGDSLVAMAISARNDIKTRFGFRSVLDVVTYDAEDIVKSLWWPRGIPQPPLLTAFHLHRFSKDAIVMNLADGDDQAREMWRTGKLPGGKAPTPPEQPKPAAAPDLSPVKAALAKLNNAKS